MGQKFLLEIFDVVALLQIFGTFFSLDQFAIQMHRSLYDLVLLRQYLHFVHNRIEEYLGNLSRDTSTRGYL